MSPADKTPPPLVTLFVLAYRQQDFVRAAIEGAFAQTWSPLEIILSDDASPDDTYRVMQEMAAAYDGPHQVVLNRNPQNLGLAGHISRVMQMALGAFVVQNAGDDISRPHRVARLTEAWQAGAGRIGAVHSAMQRLESDGSVSDYPPLRPLLDPLNPQDMITREFHLIGASMGWDRKLFDVFGPLPPDTLIEDRPLAFRAALLGSTAWVDEPLLLYRAGGASDPGTLARERRQPLRRRHHVRRQRWRRSHLIAYLRDMDIVAPPEAEECRRLCEERLTLLDLELGLADAGLAGRLGQAGQALALAARRRDPAALRILAKYLADGLRYRQGPAAAG